MRKAKRQPGRQPYLQIQKELMQTRMTICELLELWDTNGPAADFTNVLEKLREQLPTSYHMYLVKKVSNASVRSS